MSARNRSQDVNPEQDLKEVEKLLSQGRLDEVLGALDPQDVAGTIKRVPAAAVRLLASLLTIPDVDKKIEGLDPGQRKLAVQLLESAKRHKGKEFADALTRELPQNEEVRDQLGITLRPPEEREQEGRIENAWNVVEVRPQLMLDSGRVYCMIAFWRDKELVFRSDVELHSVFWAARAFVQAARQALNVLSKHSYAEGARVDSKKCIEELETISKLSDEATALLKNLTPKNQHTATTKRRRKRT